MAHTERAKLIAAGELRIVAFMEYQATRKRLERPQHRSIRRRSAKSNRTGASTKTRFAVIRGGLRRLITAASVNQLWTNGRQENDYAQTEAGVVLQEGSYFCPISASSGEDSCLLLFGFRFGGRRKKFAQEATEADDDHLLS
jgi:hypothetical protein